MIENTNSKLIVLDCESIESTFKSISKIYSIKPNEIKAFLINKDLDEYYRKYDPPYTGDKVLGGLFEKEFNKPTKNLGCVFWNHLTRTLRGHDFREGILPLNEAIEKIIWPAFFKIFRGTKHLTRLKHMKQHGVDDRLYKMKIQHEYLGGPYALLIYDKAFERTTVKTGFLEFPEIIEDICNGYQNSYNKSIHNIVKNSLVPCVVKFKSRKQLYKLYVTTALYYLYNIYHKKEQSIYSNSCFDGEGESIPFEDIIKIEYLDKE